MRVKLRFNLGFGVFHGFRKRAQALAFVRHELLADTRGRREIRFLGLCRRFGEGFEHASFLCFSSWPTPTEKPRSIKDFLCKVYIELLLSIRLRPHRGKFFGLPEQNFS